MGEPFAFEPRFREEILAATTAIIHELVNREVNNCPTWAVDDFVRGVPLETRWHFDGHHDRDFRSYSLTREEERTLFNLLQGMAGNLLAVRQQRVVHRTMAYIRGNAKKYDVIDLLARRLAADIPRENSPPLGQ